MNVSGSLVRQRSDPAVGSPAAVLGATRRSRVGGRGYRPARALAGALVVVVAIVAALAIYSRRGDRTEVLAVTRTVLAGETLTAADLHVVAVSSDGAVDAITAGERTGVVGAVARVRLPAGSVLVAGALQPDPLGDPAAAAVSIEVPASRVPTGLRERSRVVLIVWPASTTSARGVAPMLVEGVVTAVPADLVHLLSPSGSGTTQVALGVEVPPDAVAAVGGAEAISLGVLDPTAPTLNAPGEATS